MYLICCLFFLVGATRWTLTTPPPSSTTTTQRKGTLTFLLMFVSCVLQHYVQSISIQPFPIALEHRRDMMAFWSKKRNWYSKTLKMRSNLICESQNYGTTREVREESGF